LSIKVNAKRLYQQNLNGISDSDSNSNTSPEQLQRCVLLDRFLKCIKSLAHVLPGSRDVPKVKYATEWYLESPDRPSLSPVTKKRNYDELKAEMAEISSMSESEIHAVMEKQTCKKQADKLNSWCSAAICKVIWNSISVANPI
jgi:hypothetical protein